MRSQGLFAAAMAALLAACSELPSVTPELDREPLDGEPVEVIRLAETLPAHYSGMTQRERVVVRTPAEWEIVWRRMWAGHSPLPPVPAVDFERHVLLVAAMGSRPTGGYHIRIAEAAALADEVAVRVVETSPSRGCITTQAFTAPVDVVKLPRTSRQIQFRTAEVVHECG